MKKIIFTLLVFSLFTQYSPAQSGSSNPNYAFQNNAWIMYFGQHALNEHWKLHTEYQWRRSEYFNYWQQSLLRLGMEYTFSPNLSVTAGYGWINTYPYGEQPIIDETGEHRIWQQLVQTNTFGRFSIQHRYRLEQRWVDQWKMGDDGSHFKNGFAYSNRVRYRLMINFAINKPAISKGSTFLSIYNEPFISFGDAIKNNFLDQNRLYTALGYQYSTNGNIQLGYLNQLLIKSDGYRREINHTLQIGITHNLDLRQKELM